MASQFMQAICEHMTMRGYSRRTIKAYCYWIKYFIHFHRLKHPEQMHATEVVSFLSHLANQQKVAINTQKVALNALAYLYNQFIKQPLGDLGFRFESIGMPEASSTRYRPKTRISHCSRWERK